MGEPIDCRKAAEQLQDFLKQELTPELEAEMRAHLERCRPCFDHAKFEANFVLMLGDRARRFGCPEALRARITKLLRIELERG
jgi:anti-sigma factor (TIGR02949 family)